MWLEFWLLDDTIGSHQSHSLGSKIHTFYMSQWAIQILGDIQGYIPEKGRNRGTSLPKRPFQFNPLALTEVVPYLGRSNASKFAFRKKSPCLPNPVPCVFWVRKIKHQMLPPNKNPAHNFIMSPGSFIFLSPRPDHVLARYVSHGPSGQPLDFRWGSSDVLYCFFCFFWCIAMYLVHYIVLYYFKYHIVLYDIMLCYILSYHIMLYHFSVYYTIMYRTLYTRYLDRIILWS